MLGWTKPLSHIPESYSEPLHKTKRAWLLHATKHLLAQRSHSFRFNSLLVIPSRLKMLPSSPINLTSRLVCFSTFLPFVSKFEMNLISFIFYLNLKYTWIIHTTPNLDMNNSISSAILDFWQSYYFFPFKTSLRDEKKHGMRLLLCFWAY